MNQLMISNQRLKLAMVTAMFFNCLAATSVFGQRKPERAEAPKFAEGQYKNVFFPDPSSQLKGKRPDGQATANPVRPSATNADNSQSAEMPAASQDAMAWHNLISPTSLEDLIKGAKLRLDKAITTPAAFAGGGFAVARREFSMLALLFAIIEKHPGDVRWKSSAPTARDLLTRVAANSKVGSQQVYAEAKKRLQDLGDLTNGAALTGNASSEIAWSQLIDRVPLMQLLEWAQRDNINSITSNPADFAKNKDAVQRFAELVAVLGKASLIEDMPDANDDDYVTIAKEMIEQARQLSEAARTGNAELARQSAAKLGQSCNKCHEVFR
jgi:Cytochrome C'